MKILIVGGVAGGASFAARMRRLDEKAEIIIFEKGEYIAFANCGLPYYIGDVIRQKSALTLYTPQSFQNRFNIDVKNFSEVTSIDTKQKNVTVKNSATGKTYTESYDKLVLAPGAAPIRPPIQGIDNERIFTLRNIPDTYAIKEFIDNKKPKRVVVVGGGYIGVEMAENLAHIGLDVTIIEQGDHLIAPLDKDMALIVHHYLTEKGVKIVLNNGVSSIEGGTELKVTMKDGFTTTDMVLMSVGVRPDTALAVNAGIAVNKRGAIIVNDQMITSDKDIYAVGDAIEVTDFVTKDKAFIPLAGPANKQGRIAADNIAGFDSRYKETQGSAILKIFDMTVASTGINERAAIEKKINYGKAIINAASHAKYYPDATPMWIKTVFEKKTGKILGTQIVGYNGVDKRADVFAVAIRAGMTAFDLTELELCYAPPFSSAKDPVNMMGYVIENIITGKVKTVQWEDVVNLPTDGSVNLIDVRDSNAGGGVKGFKNIPLNTLRDNLDKIDKSKPVYLHCYTGLSSYIACRILMGNGFDCYNICGGYEFYKYSIK